MNRQLFEYHPVIGYKFIPELKVRLQHEAGGYLLRTNNLGFRSETDYQPGKDPAKKRILFFGDSFTAGDGVSNKYRYTDVLQQMLPETEVYNFGLPGSGTDQQFLIYKEYGHAFDYDLLVIAVLVENIRRIKSHYRYYYNDEGVKMVYQKPYYDFRNGEFQLFNTPVRQQPLKLEELPKEEHEKVDTGGRFETARTIINALGLKELTQKLTKYQPVPEYNKADSPEWLIMKEILTQWCRMAKSKVLVVPLPLYQFIEETSDAGKYQERFAELAKEVPVEVHDPLPDLQQYSMADRRNFRFKDDVHPTPEGHRAIAESLFKKIKQML
jgi:carbamoyltransferase